MDRLSRLFSLLFFAILFTSNLLPAQELAESDYTDFPEVFLDCRSCDMNYLRTALPYVNYVRDQQLAQIHIFVTTQSAGSGGRSFDLSFLGKEEFEGTNFTLSYTSLPTDTQDDIRKGLAQRLKLGLAPYMAGTELVEDIDFSVENTPSKEPKKEKEKDGWRNWIFEVYGNGSFRTESSRSDIRLSYGMDANHISETWRVRIRPRLSYRQTRFESDGEEILSIIRSSSYPSSVVRSLNDHWSAGFFSSFSNSTYRNIDLDAWHAPAIEYSFFPYSEVARREFTIAYHTGYFYRNYAEETIYGKMQENLWRQTVLVRLIMRQPWGSLYAGLQGSSYMHDMSQNRLELNSNLNLRVFKGLSMKVTGNLDLIQDQLSLPKGSASLQDILLQQRQLATDYEMFVSLGVSYTFGSIYNNIVNTRL